MKFQLSLIVAALLFFSPEAQVSQVSYSKEKSDLSTLVQVSTEIWLVKDLQKIVSIKKVVFPKETHWKKTSTDTFEQTAGVYELVKPLKQRDVSLKKGDSIRVLIPEAYGEALIKAYHEKNETESPIIRQYQAQYPIEGHQRILFLLKNTIYPGTYDLFDDAAEGPLAETKIQEILKSQPNSHIPDSN